MNPSNNPIKVFHLRASPFLGSPEKLLLNRLKVMDGNICQYILGIFDEQPGNTNDFLQAAQQLKARTLQLQDSLFFLIPNLKKLRREIKSQNINIICSHDYKSNLYALLTAKMLNIPALAIFHGRTKTDRKSLIYESFDNLLIPYFDVLICVSEHTKKQIKKVFKNPPPVFVIPNAISLELNNNVIPTPNPEQLTKKDNQKKAVFAGRLCSEKGIFDLVSAVKKVIKNRKDITFFILGDGPEKNRLKKSIEDNDLSNFIKLCGFSNNINDYYKSMDFLILPSLSESMPMVILEAFALRKPVIATTVGGIPEIVQDNISGLLVKAGDVQALANAINTLLDDPQKVIDMGNNAYAHIVAHHTVKDQAAKYLSVYKQILGNTDS
jgi:glycosyltransferase involved in cell wall biosynthesis